MGSVRRETHWDVPFWSSLLYLGNGVKGGQPVGQYGFTVCCSDAERKDHPAKYKIAAEWTDGGYTELKTYGFADDECIDRVVRAAMQRMAKVSLSEGEMVSELHIYLLDSSRHDYELTRVAELERKYNAQFNSADQLSA